ncbi:MAG: hypothetical protein K1X89_03115 [Myxococcaceae bacterium]|nr:hypothetical protein [Myxococcaceae bacterium]
MAEFREYSVSKSDKEPLLRFILEGLVASGCRILQASEPSRAPFRITFETPTSERMGIVVYAFFANSRLTKNRPDDEHRFQVKYGPDDRRLHNIWQDPYLLYTTLFCGIDPERGIFVGADPVLHSPTKFFISIEYKEEEVAQILRHGWHSWERDHRANDDKPVEVLVGGTAHSFLRYVRFEREALGEDQGHRMLLAERMNDAEPSRWPTAVKRGSVVPAVSSDRLHALAAEFEMSESGVLDLIASARRLKMAVRGWVAESHLVKRLERVPGVSECLRVDEEGGPDISLKFEGSLLTVECKNVLRKTTAEGLARVDFQRTRASKSDPCSRYYAPSEFDVIAACLHAVSEKWEFKYVVPSRLDRHMRCRSKLSNNVKVDDRWSTDVVQVLRVAAS